MKPGLWRAGDLAEALGCLLIGSAGIELSGVAPMEEADSSHLTFLANPKYRKHLESCRAGGIIISPEETTPQGVLRFETPKPYLAFLRALELFYPNSGTGVPIGIHPMAAISPAAKIGKEVRIGPFVQVEAGAVIGDRVTLFSGSFVGIDSVIGDDSVLGVGVVIRHEVTLGRKVVIGDGSVIGWDGFGYAPDETGFHKIPQVGTVEIADEVELGANCCVDRATVGATRIGKGSKLDNLIQVAHGVQIGENTVIAAQVGISGSTRIGSGVMIGGQAGFIGHIEIGDRMIIGAQAGVTKSWDIHGMVSGYPARVQMEEMRIEVGQNQLPELLKRVRKLELELKKPDADK